MVILWNFYWQGNVFTPVYDSVHREGVSVQRGLSVSCNGDHTRHYAVMYGQYASYWNAFLFYGKYTGFNFLLSEYYGSRIVYGKGGLIVTGGAD